MTKILARPWPFWDRAGSTLGPSWPGPTLGQCNPAIWKYFMRVHFEEKHKTFDLTKYEHLWKLSNFERSEMKKIWVKRGKVTTKHTKKSKIPPLIISESHHARIPGMYMLFCPCCHMKKDHFRVPFLSDDHEPCLSRPCSPEGEEDKVTEAEGIDADDAEGGDFDEEEAAGGLDVGNFWGGLEDLDNVASVGREDAGKDREMWTNFASVRNSTGCEVEALPIMQDSEPSISDSVSPIINSGKIYLQCPINRTIK